MNILTPDERRIAYARLVRGYADAGAARLGLAARWDWLMAAHVVGQEQAALHFDSHKRMLALARETRDWGEVAAQVLRLALLPLGHVLGRIPHGNIGRGTVGPTQEMEPPEPVQVLIDWAVLATKLPA